MSYALPVEYLYNDVVGSITTSLLYVCLLLYLYTFFWICVLQVLTLYTAQIHLNVCKHKFSKCTVFAFFNQQAIILSDAFADVYLKIISRVWTSRCSPLIPTMHKLLPLFDWRSEQITSKNAGKSIVHGRKWQEGIWKRSIFPRLTRAQDEHPSILHDIWEMSL